MKLVIAAGGTGGHIFPALSIALGMRVVDPSVSLQWIGTSRSRERELCTAHAIPLKVLPVAGINKKVSIATCFALLQFLRAIVVMFFYFKRVKPDAVIAFGGYVCAPVLVASKLLKIPYYIHEQNSVVGRVNRFFVRNAHAVFLGFQIPMSQIQKNRYIVCGTPVRKKKESYPQSLYPPKLVLSKKTILISGGSQGAASMNNSLVDVVKTYAKNGVQVVWQTGKTSFDTLSRQMNEYKYVFLFESIEDLYPFYSIAQVVICRAGASTLSEIALFGIPCIMIPLPWAADNHQWINAGLVENQGWGFRIKQDSRCQMKVSEKLEKLLEDDSLRSLMCGNSLKHSPENATQTICDTIGKRLQ